MRKLNFSGPTIEQETAVCNAVQGDALSVSGARKGAQHQDGRRSLLDFHLYLIEYLIYLILLNIYVKSASLFIHSMADR
jgi:hypothetical protein